MSICKNKKAQTILDTLTMTTKPLKLTPADLKTRKAGSSKFSCTISNGTESEIFSFFQGSGHKGKFPHISGVLLCLAMDATYTTNGATVEDFCKELGCGIEGLKIWKAIKANTEKLKNLMTEEDILILADMENEED